MTSELVAKSKDIRKRVIGLISKSKSSHLGSNLSIVDLLVYLYYKEMNFSLENYKSFDRDRFILSKGHGALSVYTILEDIGIIPKADLERYYANDSKLIGHINHKVEGVEVSTGALGHGLPIAAGIALGLKLSKSKSRVFCIIGDGESNEGSIWEALMFTCRMKLDNLTVILDYNQFQGLDRSNDIVNTEMLKRMLKSLDLNYHEIDGHNFDDISNALNKIRKISNKKPNFVFAHTVKGKGVSFMEGKLEWHYKSPDDSQFNLAIDELK